MIRFANESEEKRWNALVLNNPDGGNVFQSREMAEQKRLSGWEPRFIVADRVAITVLQKKIPLLGYIWYVMKGPGISDATHLTRLLPTLRDFAKKENVFAVKIEPEIIKTDSSMDVLTKAGLIPVRPIQPNSSTVLLDLSDDPEQILMRINQKARHAIRRAGRDGAEAEAVDATENNCREMYELLSQTAEDQFTIRPYEYYREFWQRFSQAGMGQLFFARYENRIVAGAYALIFGEKSTYKDGASLRDKPVYGASHLLQWRVIEWAKSKGARQHDLCGVPPTDRLHDPTHPFHGLALFKTSFNKTVTDYVGAFDLIVRPSAYGAWRKLFQRAALSYHFRRHHENFY